MILADSDVLIDFLRGMGPHVDRVARELAAGRLSTSATTVFELVSGARTAKQQRAVAALLAALLVHDVDREVAARAGRVFRDLRTVGSEIPMADCLLASVSLVSGTEFLTRNLKHFERVPDLTLVT